MVFRLHHFFFLKLNMDSLHRGLLHVSVNFVWLKYLIDNKQGTLSPSVFGLPIKNELTLFITTNIFTYQNITPDRWCFGITQDKNHNKNYNFNLAQLQLNCHNLVFNSRSRPTDVQLNN